MARYIRQQRQGFKLYHEDVELLSNLPADDFKELILALARFSIDLARNQEPEEPTFTGWSAALWGIVSSKVDRDHGEYVATNERNAQNAAKRQRSTAVNEGQPTSAVVGDEVTKGRPEATNSNSSSNGNSNSNSSSSNTCDNCDLLTIPDEEVARYRESIAAIEDAAKGIGLPFASSDFLMVEQLIADYSSDWVLAAINRAQDRNRNWGVVKGILRSWKEQGKIDDGEGIRTAAKGPPAIIGDFY